MENNSKLRILNHRSNLMFNTEQQSQQNSHLEDITNEDTEHEMSCFQKRFKLESESPPGELLNPNEDMQIDPIDSIRNELLMSPIPCLSSDMLRLKSNFDLHEDSNSTSASTSGTSSYLSSPRRDGNLSPSLDLDLALDISISTNFNNNNQENTFNYSNQNLENTLFKPINNLLKYNLNNLHLTRKDTIYFLIEQNLLNRIKSPFDLFAYNRLKTFTSLNHEQIKTSKFNYNYLNIKKLSKLLNYYENPLDKKYLKQNNLLPCCASQFLMPFYFDIFKVSELNQFSQPEIDMILLLKRTYKAQIYLDYECLIGNYKENILWNCFVLFKYKFSSLQTSRMEFFNFYLAMGYSLQHLEYVVEYLQNRSQIPPTTIKDHISKALELSLTLPLLLDTLILTGMFKHVDFVRFKRFAQTRLFFSENNKTNTQIQTDYLEKVYYENSLKNVAHRAEQCFPLKLKHLCRIRIKESMKLYDSNQVNKFSVPKAIKSFLLYEDEVNEFYAKYKNLINQNSISFTSSF